jgi:hypothetical protein
MNQFFDNIQAFCEALQTKKDTGNRCWSCSSTRTPLVSFNIRRDLESLDMPTECSSSRITLCRDCAVAYMNSFNKNLGLEKPPPLWTVDQYLLSYCKSRMRSLGTKPTIHCEPHGDSPFSAICKHLLNEVGLRYFAVKLEPDHPCVGQAWCEKCHAVLKEEGGWTDRSKKFAELSLVCTHHTRELLRFHKRQQLIA